MSKRKMMGAVLACTCLTFAACGGGDPDTSAPTSAASEAPSTGSTTATLLVARSNPAELTSFPVITTILDRSGIEYSDVEDLTDDESWSDGPAGKLDIEGLGTVYFMASENPKAICDIN